MMACIASIVFSLPCQLHRPAAAEPQLFYFGSQARSDDVDRAMRFTAATPILGPIVEWKPEVEPIIETAERVDRKVIRSRKKATRATQELAYADPAPEPTRSIFSIFSAASRVPRAAGVDRSKQGYREVERAARKYRVDVDLALRIAKQESGGSCGATSGAGARGVLQVMPKTGRRHGVTNARHLYDCRVGAEAGVKEMRRLLDLTSGDVRKTLIGYNCGEACIGRRRLPKETQDYVKIVLGK